MKLKWYLQTWFICLLAACWPVTAKVSGIIALILLYLQHKQTAAFREELAQVAALKEEAREKLELAGKEAEEIIDKAKAKLSEITKTVAQLRQEEKELKAQITALDRETVVKAANLAAYDGLTSAECRDKLALLQTKQAELIKEGKALVITSEDAKKVLNNNIKQLTRCFNSECNYIISNVSVKNVDNSRRKIQKSYEVLNNIFATDGVALSYDLLAMKLEELNLVYADELKRAEEREIQKAIREQMVEEEKVRKEIEREKAKIEKEEAQFKKEVSKLIKYMQGSTNDVEKELYIHKIKELEEKLALLEKDRENVLQREQNTRAGFVYVISNIGSLGDDVYKIGMTRRLEPMDRIKELSDASVPFPFDVHALIFSEDAPSLENTLHRTFRAQEVNKVNSRKEFFRTSLETIKKVVRENHNATVQFTDIAEAQEYRETLRLNEMQGAG